MIKTLAGSNSLALHRRLDELTNAFIKEHGELSLTKLDAEEVESSAVVEAVQAMPFLSAKKMVVVRSLSANKPAAEAIEQILEAANEQTDLIIVEPTPDKRTVYYKTLQKKTELESFDEPDEHNLANWALDEARRLGASLSLPDARYLAERVGANQQLLASELAKLSTYSPEITKDTVELLTEPTPQSKIFELLDAAFAGNKSAALNLYQQQRAQKVEPQMILAMVAWQLKALTAVKLAKGRPSAQVAKDFALNPYVVSKSSRLADKISVQRLAKLVSEAVEMDLKSKTVTYDLDEALQNYLVTI